MSAEKPVVKDIRVAPLAVVLADGTRVGGGEPRTVELVPADDYAVEVEFPTKPSNLGNLRLARPEDLQMIFLKPLPPEEEGS